MRFKETTDAKLFFVFSLDQSKEKCYSLHQIYSVSPLLFHPAARRVQVGRTLRMWEFNNSRQRCARQWKEEWDLCQRCQSEKVGRWCLLSKWQLPVGVPRLRLLGSRGKIVSLVGDRVIRSWHCIHCTLPTELLYDLLVGNALYKDRHCSMGEVLRKLRVVRRELTACAFQIW